MSAGAHKKKEKSTRVPLEKHAQVEESVDSPAEGGEMSLKQTLVPYGAERHPPLALGRYHHGGGYLPELFRA